MAEGHGIQLIFDTLDMQSLEVLVLGLFSLSATTDLRASCLASQESHHTGCQENAERAVLYFSTILRLKA